jgi:hypothetical protein
MQYLRYTKNIFTITLFDHLFFHKAKGVFIIMFIPAQKQHFVQNQVKTVSFQGHPPKTESPSETLEKTIEKSRARNPESSNSKFSTIKQSLAWVVGLGSLLSAVSPLALAQDKPATPEKTTPQVQTDQPKSAATKHEPAPIIVDIDKQLKGDGVTGRIHGADSKSGLMVFNYFKMTESILSSVNLSVIAGNDDAQKILDTVKRHDKVLIKGRIKNLNNPQPHIIAESVEIKQPYKPEGTVPEKAFEKQTKLPEELKGKTEATFLVHANVEKGKAIVLEYKDQLLMLISKDASLTENLWRGDKVKLQYNLREFPGQPTHLMLNTKPTEGKKPVEMLDQLGGPDRGNPEKPAPMITQEGALVKFPKSPAINRDIWAIEQKDPDGGASRYFTLVNFEIEGEFDRIGKVCRELWDTANKPTDILDGRNKQIHKTIRIKVSGKLNVEDPNQANAQIFLKADEIQPVK